jgi:hypothetical protein
MLKLLRVLVRLQKKFSLTNAAENAQNIFNPLGRLFIFNSLLSKLKKLIKVS